MEKTLSMRQLGGIVSSSAKWDELYLGGGITPEDVQVTRDRTDLILEVGAEGDQVTVKEWYDLAGVSGWDRRLEHVRFDDGTVWDVNTVHEKGMEPPVDAARENQVLQMVSAMAAFNPVSPGDLNLALPTVEEISPTIAPAWQSV